MDRFYNRCIFCRKKLPSNSKGEGEHVIPKNIYGFWRIYDICDECKQYFGDNIDQISLQNMDILDAMKGLNLPNADKLFENLSYVGFDTIDKRKIPMIKKGDGFKIKSTMKDKQFLECSEDDWDNYLVRWLENNVGNRIDKDEFNREIEHLKVKYDALKPGETVHSSVLNYSIRKRQTHNLEVNHQKLPPISKLIAKIVICFLRYVLTPQQIETIPNYELLIKHARFEGPLEKPLINWCARASKIKYHMFHKIAIYTLEKVQMVDVTFFGYPNWRTVLGSTSPIIIKDNRGNELKELWFVLDFKNLENREKYICLKYAGDSQLRCVKGEGL